MKVSSDVSIYPDTNLYNSFLDLLKDIKLVHGVDGLNATLIRHKKIKLFLTDYQKRAIIDLENKL